VLSLRSLLFFAIFVSLAGFSELITIKTTNGDFQFPKEIILEGPEGFMKNALKHSSRMSSTFLKDGSLFANVDHKSMRIALDYIRSGTLATEIAQTSPIFINDLKYLFPDLKLGLKKSIWKCGAYCRDNEGHNKFLTASSQDMFTAWEFLNRNCFGLLLKTRTYYQTVDPVIVSMKDACVEIEE